MATSFQNENMFYVQETSMDISSMEQAVKKTRSLEYLLKWEPYATSTGTSTSRKSQPP